MIWSYHSIRMRPPASYTLYNLRHYHSPGAQTPNTHKTQTNPPPSSLHTHYTTSTIPYTSLFLKYGASLTTCTNVFLHPSSFPSHQTVSSPVAPVQILHPSASPSSVSNPSALTAKLPCSTGVSTSASSVPEATEPALNVLGTLWKSKVVLSTEVLEAREKVVR